MFDLNSFLAENLPVVKNYAESNNMSRHDAEDVASNVICDFYLKHSQGKVDTSKNPKAYLFKLARWRIFDKSREKTRAAKLFEQIGEENDLDVLPHHSEDNQWKIDLLVSAAHSIKKKVNSQYYNLFCSQVFDGLKAEEAARMFQSSVATAHLAKHRAGKEVIAAAKEMLKNGI